jgi:parvulin-like peptidyl-prolyl isomerase
MTVALKIGDRTIPGGDVVALLQQYRLLEPLVKEIVIEQALETWVAEEVDAWTEADDAEVLQQFQAQQAMAAMAPQGPVSSEALETQQTMMAKKAKLDKFKLWKWGNQLESYFLKRKGRLDRVIYSLLRVKDAAVSQELYFRLESDEASFTDLATQYSKGPEANTGGLIGPADLGGCHPRLSEMLRVSQPSQLWPPTRIEDWWVIVRLEKFLPAQLDEGLRRRLLDELFSSWLQEQSQQFEVVQSPVISGVES